VISLEEIKKKKIAVICGGWSSERDVSLRSGENVFNALKSKGYNVVKIDLDENIVENLKKEKVDFAYIALHGSPGEDGTIQGLLEIINIPYTGSGVLGSAISLDKIVSKQIFIANNIPTPPFYIIREKQIDFEEIKKLGFPIIFKPREEGSSIGIKKIDTFEKAKKDLVELAEKYKDGIVEKFIKGKDITVGVLDEGKSTYALPILELRPKKEFYDYEAKYTKGLTEFIIPAQIDEELTKYIMDLAVKTHKAVFCYGVSRVDMVVKERDVFVLEVNSLPGMTDTSDLPAEAKAMGISFPELVEKILLSGFNRNG